MLKINHNTLIGNAFFLTWLILCLSIFIIFPGRISIVQWSNLANWQSLPEKLARLDMLVYLVELFKSFVGITVFGLASTSLGLFVTKIFGFTNKAISPGRFELFAVLTTNFLIGSSLFSVVFLTIAGLHHLSEFSVILVLLFGLFVGFRQLKAIILNAIRKGIFKASYKPEGGTEKILFWLSIAILALSLLHATTRISYDASAVYFSDAKMTALAHRVQYFTDNAFVASLFQSAIQFTALIHLFGDQSARMLTWVYGMVSILFGLALGKKVGLSRQANTILLALMLTSTAFIDLMGDGKVDLISTAPAIASIYWLVVTSQDNAFDRPKLLLIGFLIGLACVARPFNVFLLGVFIFLFYVQQAFLSNLNREKNPKIFLYSLIWIGVGAVGWGIYHLFTNWMILGNPLAFLSSVSAINPSTGPWNYDPDQILITRLLYPFVVSFKNTPQSLGNISPLFIAFLPLVFTKSIWKEIKFSVELKNVLVIAIITLLLWISTFFTILEIRYVFFLWIILFLPLAAIIASTLSMGDQIFQNIKQTLTILLLLFFVLRTVFISVDAYSPLDKEGNPTCHDNGYCESLKPINKIAKAGDRVLTLGAYRYYLRTDLFACSTTHEEYDVLQEFSHKYPDAFWREVYRRGYKFIAYENDYTTRHLQFGLVPDPREVPSWMNLEPIFGEPDDLIVTYQINVTNPPIVPTTSCQKSERGIWHLVTTPL